MKSTALAAVLGACLLSGCAAQNVHDVLGNLDRDCVRHYQGSAATGTPIGTATITFTIDCKPNGEAAPPAPASAMPEALKQ